MHNSCLKPLKPSCRVSKPYFQLVTSACVMIAHGFQHSYLAAWYVRHHTKLLHAHIRDGGMPMLCGGCLRACRGKESTGCYCVLCYPCYLQYTAQHSTSPHCRHPEHKLQLTVRALLCSSELCISELPADLVVVAIKLAHANALGIQAGGLHCLQTGVLWCLLMQHD